MTAEAPQAGSGPQGPLHDDDGVSPVIGMILVLAISIVGIAGILYWGLPAIDEMKANVEHRSVQSQFQDLDATLKELVAGTTEKTAKRWNPTINRGEVGVRNNTESWVFAADGYQADGAILSSKGSYDFGWANLADGNQSFTVWNAAWFGLNNTKVEAYTVGAGASLTQLNLSLEGVNAPGAQNSGISNWYPNTSKSFTAYVSSTTTVVRLNGGPFYFRIYNGSTIVGEAWYMNTSRVDYALHAGVSDRTVTENNGAVLTGVAGSYTIVNSPPIPPPSTTSGTHRFFARALLINGSAAGAGDNQFDLLISLYATSVLATKDCALSTHTDCVSAAKVYIYGSSLQTAWYAYLTDANRGYGSISQKTATWDTNVKYLEDRQSYMGFTLIESTLNVTG